MWRYSGIDDFDLDGFAPSSQVEPSSEEKEKLIATARDLASRVGPRSALVITLDGKVVSIEGDIEGGPLTVDGASVADGDPGLLAERIGSLAPARDGFGELHDAFMADAAVVTVAPKSLVREPVVVVHVVGGATIGESPGASAFPHTSVTLGAGSEASLMEILVGAGRALVVPVTELEVADASHLRYANVQVLSDTSWQVAVQASRVGRDANLRSFTVAFGGRYARVRTDSDLVGQAGSTSLLAAYLGTGDQVLDFRTLQDHHAPHTESELLFEGAVAGSSRSVYSGLIRIRHGARGSNAFQTNRNLVLSEGAHADSVPNLDIDENDVRCSHASTVGPIDEEQKYYLESRGIGPKVAERLIVRGFFSDLAARAPFESLGRWVEDSVEEKLSASWEPASETISGDGNR